MFSIVALVDPPTSNDYRQVAVLIREGTDYKVRGYTGLPNDGLVDVDDLIGHMLCLPPFDQILMTGPLYRVSWMGLKWLERAEELEVLPEEFVLRQQGRSPDGCWRFFDLAENRCGWMFVADWELLLRFRERWLRRVCLGVLEGRYDKRHAILTKRCDPDHEYSRIAVWHSLREDEDAQMDALRWTCRLHRESGYTLEGSESIKALARHYEARSREMLTEAAQES